ncbi:M10 family metallopeptidase C-terminal domain-containing protein [Hydrogenophaga aromaticivorans]|uniref:peroxidase family protein n=1 Tax=Hydrogenophaga aromaticivorans TaxID=2610898 RepID=UPI001B38C5CA|nr:peroxidase family protein [Hydrogenophaga aromaticivorans]MBQ0920052.1 M10 family metallopeptidase C-terminal domain-containing protein [Hydrogenophaga aromaticivorans]
MATNYQLKPYAFNFNDLKFLEKQINFKPLFDEQGNAIIQWDGTGAVYNSNDMATRVLYADLGTPEANIAAYGTSYAYVTDFAGLREPSGHNNNLYLVNADWGANDQPFLQRTQVVFDQYVKPLDASDPNAHYALKFTTPPTAGADYEKTATHSVQNVVDYTPRMISRLTTTAGVTFDTQPGSTHLVKDANGFTQVADYGDLQASGLLDTQPAFNEDGTPNTEYFIGATNPGVAPVNGWFVLFGQFFDHGLDFIGKGSDGTKITINLATDDPMYGVIDPNTGQPTTKIVISRADVSGFTADGTAQWVNHTSPYIDQSQTYGSDQEVTDILREWVSTDGGLSYHASSHLIDGQTSVAWKNAFGETTNATLPTLNELRAHLLATGRDDLTWEDVANLRNRDASGHVATGAEAGSSGQALLLDFNPRFDTAHFTNPLNPEAAAGFADNIATLTAAAQALGPDFNFGYDGETIFLTVPAGIMGPGAPAMTVTGASALALWVNFGDFSIKSTMQAGPDIIAVAQEVRDAVGDLLLASVGDHYIAGDGRANENIGLTAVHHVWHEEHNFQVRNIQNALATEDLRQERLDQAGTYDHDLLKDWQINTGTQDANGNYTHGVGGAIAWNEDKLFHAAKITVEMEYQHTAIDQFARTITPNIAEFVGYNAGSQGDVSLDFSQVAYRFGHSTLRESIDLMDPDGDLTGAIMRVALEKAFLNPELFANTGAAAIALGMTHQQANEIDEYVTPALNQGLLGLPLDLAAINIARGRDVGIPTLNAFRAAINLDEYVSWADFGANMIHPDNLVNFIAAYSFDGNVDRAAALIGLDNGSIAEGDAEAMGYTYQQALDFMNNTDASLYGVDGFNHIDTWLGGLAEVHVTGGLLGETFDTVFADQMTRLMNGDRFYYLYRLDQLQMGEGIINEQFKDIVERNTGAEHLNGSVFAYADKYYDLAETADADAKTEHKYGEVQAQRALDDLSAIGIYSTKGNATTGNGSIVTINGVQYIRDLRVDDGAATSGTTAINGGLNLDGTPNSGAESHEVIVASDNNDLIYAWGGDDTVYAEGGDDIVYGGNGIDRIYGGDGDDRILGGDGGDLLDGGAGDDYVSGQQTAVAAAGIDQVIGGEGNDILHSGVGIDKLSGESGDDFIFGEEETDAFTHGGDGNDVIDGGVGGDLLWADDGDDLVIGGDDQDISAGGNGDDILRPGIPSLAMGGGPDEVVGGLGKTDLGNDGKGFGFDLIDFSDHPYSPQGVSVLFSTQQNPLVQIDVPSSFPAWVGVEGVIASQGNDTINADVTNVFGGANWLIGGSGNDSITGGLGNDVIVGDGIRLDSLIGTYAGAYDQYLDGASHRAAGFIQDNGLLDAVGFGADKHMTTMLSSATFQNLVLGGSEVTRLWRNGVVGTDLADSVVVGDGGTVGTADTAVFSGNRADYTVEKILFDTQNQGQITAYKITDSVADRDGTDVVVGVESFKFADGTFNEVDLLNLAPVITSDGGGADAAKLVAENTLMVTTVVASDADLPAQPLTFSIAGGADAALFVIDAGGVLSFISAPNFEATADAGGNHVYDVIVQVSDGLAVDTQALAVTVSNVNEAGTGALNIATYTPRPTGNANAAIGLIATHTLADPDAPGLVPTYQWQRLVGASWVDIAGATGEAILNQSNVTLRVTTTYDDGFGPMTAVSPETAVVGNSTANTLSGTAGTDFQLGLGGNDNLLASAGDDVIDGGAGVDAYSLAGTSAAANVNLTTGTASSATTGSDTLVHIENVIGSSAANVITDAVGANRLNGGGGDDTFVLVGDDLRDIVVGAAGADAVDYSTATANLTVNLGTATAVVVGSGTTVALSDTVNGIENFVAGSGNDSITGSSAANQLSGGLGSDSLMGAAGRDTLDGGDGDDTLTGGAGLDNLTGGDGVDVFDYNASNESGVGAAVRDLIADFVAGTDKLDFSTLDANTGVAGNQDFTFNATDGALFTGAGQLVYHHEGSGANAITVIEGNLNNNLGTDFQVALVGHVSLSASDFIL